MTLQNSEYLQLIPKNKWGCKYRRLTQKYKDLYRNGAFLYDTLSKRSDAFDPLIQEILALLIHRARLIITEKNKGTIDKKIQELDSRIAHKQSQLS